MSNLPTVLKESIAPELISGLHEIGQQRFLEFFTANIRNANTRRAYFRASVEFLDWCGERERPRS